MSFVPQKAENDPSHLHLCETGAGHANRCDACQVRLISICAALNINEIAELGTSSEPQCLSSRTVLFRQDDMARNVYNITQGTVRLSKLLPDGRRQIVGFAMAGDFLGLSLADRHGYSAEAVGSISVCKFSRQTFADFVEAKPHLLRQLHTLTAHELSLAQDQMVVLGKRNAEEKVAAFLIHLRDRIARLTKATVHVPLVMSRQDIADYLGLTLETVSRTFSKLAKNRDLVIVPDGVRLLNVERLEKLAAS